MPGPVSILGRDLNPHGAGHGIVASRKSAPTDQILNTLALHDVPYSLAVQRHLGDGDQNGIAGTKHSDEFVVHTTFEWLPNGSRLSCGAELE